MLYVNAKLHWNLSEMEENKKMYIILFFYLSFRKSHSPEGAMDQAEAK